MKFIARKMHIFYILLPVLIFFIVPIDEVKSAPTYFGCTINGICENVLSPTIGLARSIDCRDGEVTTNTCPILDYKYFTKNTTNNDCECNQIPVPEGVINILQAGDYLKKLSPEPEPCGNQTAVEDAGAISEDLTTKLRLVEGTCPELNATVLYPYYCIVIGSPEDKFKPGDCRVFESSNEVEAYQEARNLCAIDSAQAEEVRAVAGVCPSVKAQEDKSGSVPGASLKDLQAMAAKQLNPNQISDPKEIVSRAINFLTGIIGSIALLLYVVSGFMWMTAAGASEQVDKAKKIMVWTTLGVMVMLFSYILTKAVFDFIPKLG